MISMKRKVLIGVGALAVVLLLVTAGIGVLLFGHPLRVEQPTYLYIDEDDTADSVYVKLENDLHASTLMGFRLLSLGYGYEDNIYPGAYRFQSSDSAWRIFRRLQTGNQTPVRLTIPSVRTMGQLAKAVSRRLMADSASLAKAWTDGVVIAPLGYDSCSIPALFVPDTYEVYWTISPRDFLARMEKEHRRFWNSERTAKANEIGFTPVEVCTLASIVEEETANKAEKPMVAGLYINRLHVGMPLQADPTVKFALQEFGLRRILRVHLAADSPYNTYRHTGLPPGPIRIPSADGIDAVLNYAHHDYLYMCAKEDFSGTHNFSKTWSEHLGNARSYQKALNERNIK